MIKVGLTGGYATGKSFVAEAFGRLGCHVIFADKLGHEVLLPDGEAYALVVELFGKRILNQDGVINRKELAGIVFQSPELLEQLTAIVHPAVFRLEEQLLSEFEASDPDGISIVEAAILIETGRYKLFDRLVVVVCEHETQVARAMKRDAVTREEALTRIARQLPAETRLKYADFVVDTSRSKEETAARVLQIYHELRRPATNQTQ